MNTPRLRCNPAQRSRPLRMCTHADCERMLAPSDPQVTPRRLEDVLASLGSTYDSKEE